MIRGRIRSGTYTQSMDRIDFGTIVNFEILRLSDCGRMVYWLLEYKGRRH